MEGIPMTSTTEKRSLSQRLADTAGEIIIEAVKFGLNEAGTRFLGPTAWNGFKKISAPVVKKLQKQFPALSFGDPQDEKAQAVANEASQYLRTNSDLRVEKTSQNVEKISETASEILNEINELKSGTVPSGLPDNVDMTNYMEVVLMFARAQSHRKGTELNMPVFTTILLIATIEQFKQCVLEDGMASKTYKTKLGHYSVSMTARGKFKNPSGYTCRSYSIIQPDFVNDLSQHVSLSGTYCRKEGFWRPM
jgi:hypothetical protein